MIRVTTSEVCALGRFSRATLWRRVASGALPKPIDQAREAIFDRDHVLAALAVPQPRWRNAIGGIQVPPSCPVSASSAARTTYRRWNARRWELA